MEQLHCFGLLFCPLPCTQWLLQSYRVEAQWSLSVWPLGGNLPALPLASFATLDICTTFGPLKTSWTWSMQRLTLLNSVFLAVIMPPFLALRGLRLLFNQPVCMNHEAWSPHIISAACCLPTCCEPDTTSWGPLTHTHTQIYRLS